MDFTKRIYFEKTKFVKQVLDNNGYFCEHIPFCFSTEDLSNNWDNVSKKLYLDLNSQFKDNQINNYNRKKRKFTAPISINMNKDGLLRRNLFIPNIISYLDLLLFIHQNYSDFFRLCRSVNSESSVLYISPLMYGSGFRSSIMKRNNKFVGYRYKLKLDISNCYNSIYTHSITWACVGKDLAKSMYENKNVKDNNYYFGDCLDAFSQKMNNNQTNGILTGPFTSRMISELVLSRVDKELEDYNFVRFVDDYSFYFESENDAKQSISAIAKIFSKYCFTVNEKKIQIEEYPYDILDDYYFKFEKYIKDGDLYAGLQKALALSKEGKKGSIKYLLKIMDKIKIESNIETIHILISIMLNMPNNSPYIVKILDKNIRDLSTLKGVENRLNILINKELEEKHDHEALWILYFLLKKNGRLTIKNLNKLVESESDLLKIIGLDVIFNDYKNYGFNSYKDFLSKITSTLKLYDRINSTNMLSEHWLLAYTVVLNDWKVENMDFKEIKSDQYYKLFAGCKINFYHSFFKEKNNEWNTFRCNYRWCDRSFANSCYKFN